MTLDSPAPGLALGAAARGAGWLGLGAAVTKCSQTVVLLILAALLAPSAMGVLAIGALVLNVTSAITDLGSSTALVHWRGDAERAARSALTVALGLACALTAATWFVAPSLSHALRSGDTGADVIRGLILCLPFYSVAGVSQELLRRDLDFRRRVLPDVIASLIGSSVAVGLATMGHGVGSLVAGQLVQAALVMVLCWVMRPPVRPGWSLPDVTSLVLYGGHLAAANIANLAMLNLDYLVVARVLGADALGVYSMAFRLAYMPYLLVGMVVAGAAFAFLCRLDGPDVGLAVSQVTVALALTAVPLYLGMILLAPQLGLLGETWSPGVPALRWLALYGLVLTAVHLITITLNAVARTRDGLLLNLAHLVGLSGLLLVWADSGVEMVAVAQVVAGIGTLLVAIFLFRRSVRGFELSTVVRGLRPILVGAVLMSVTALVAGRLMPWTVVSAWGLLLVGGAMTLAYVVPVALAREQLLATTPSWRATV